MSTERETAAGARPKLTWDEMVRRGHWPPRPTPPDAPQPRSTEGAERKTAHPVAQGLRATAIGLSADGYKDAPDFLREAANLIDTLASPPAPQEREGLVERPIGGIRKRAVAWREKLTSPGTDSISTNAALGMLADLEAALSLLAAPAEASEPRPAQGEAEPDGALRERIREAVSGALGAKVVWQDVLDVTDAVCQLLATAPQRAGTEGDAGEEVGA